MAEKSVPKDSAGDVVNGGEKEESGEKMVAMAKVPFHSMFKYADRTDVLLMLVGMVGALGNGMSMVIMTIIFGQMIDAFGGATPDTIVPRVSKAALNFIYLAIGTGFTSFIQISCWTMTGERQATRIRSLYLKSVLRQDMTFFDVEMTTGQVVSSISADMTLIQGAIGEKVGKFVQLITTFFGGFVLAFIKGWLLTLVMLCTIPPFVAAAGIVAKMLSKISSDGLASYSDAGDIVERTIGSIRTVASFNGEKKAITLYNNFIKKAYKGAVKEGAVQGFGMGLLSLIYFSAFGLLIWYGSKLSLTKGYSGGDILTVMFAIMIGARNLGDATPCIASFEEGRVAAYRLFKTIKRRPEIDYGDSTGIVLEDIKGEVELKDVFFSYPSRPDQLIFNGFSVHASSGTTMAIVGESGSGKSTVINLVERFYDPQAGEVLIDGMNIKGFKLEWIRGKIGLVNQEPLLFMTSIRENITYGKEDATLEEIKTAAELANAARFIENLPDGYDTTVGQRGAQLSGGQKQRIAIARAILKNPKILLLDEATSALDLESERIVQDALNRIMVGRTTLVVAHRLSTVRNAHCISVVSKGKLVEQGHHDELVKDPNGAYSQLIRLQEKQQENGRMSDARLSGSASKRSVSLRRSISRSSAGSSRHSLSLPLGVPGPTELLEYNFGQGARQIENIDDKVPNKAPMGRLINLNKPEAAVLLFGSIAAAIDGAVFPTLGLAMASASKIFYESPDQQRKDSILWALLCVGLGATAMISKIVNSFLFAIAGGKLIERIRALTFQSIVHQEVAWFDYPENSSGALNGRLCIDALNVRRLVGDNLALLVQSTATLICGIVIAMVADWKLSLVILFVIPLVGLQGYAQVKFLQGFSQDAKIMYEEASQVATEAVGSIRTVASFCAEKRVMDKYNQRCQASRDQGIRTGIVGGLGFAFSYMMLYANAALCYYVGAKFVSQGKSTFGDVLKAYFALVMAMIGASQTSAMASDSAKANDSAISIFSILDRKSLIDSSSEEGSTLENVKGDIDFKHVSFKYPSRPNVQIFTDFTLTIPSGKVLHRTLLLQTVALVGQSGSGKSTVISLLERFYEPDNGAILLDRVEISSLKVSWLRDQMGLVSQEPVLFSGTIRDNIAHGKHEEVTEEEIAAAARAANAHEFISSMPQGYNTTVGERGTQLSGGQKQRIAIARAILKDPRILLLDEATSALDAESESIVQDALNHAMVGRTTVIVAHRLSTIQGADMIAVLKDGTIVEKGRHETLMGIAGGAYASLVELRTM
ncbi:ABC transporter B family member 9-like [Miscanthus floridulus]|uniref:ABC transporter B family member 9-like n=1 Tax=Miscanthus floridulus TaxID=154761 RepID=UPI0034579B4B